MDPSLAVRLLLLPRLSRDDALAGAAPCKVCDSPAAFFDVVDFNKCAGGYTFGPSGINLPWYRCDNCGFLFTSFFDDWSSEDFRRFIYNEDYVLLDPDYLSARPKRMALQLAKLLFGFGEARILDYGSGANIFASCLKEMGFPHVESYDPFSAPTRPIGPFDIVTCIEVIEHAPLPYSILADMRSFLAEDGCILIGETLQPAEIENIRCGWWYVAPRNGHVSTYAARTFAALAERTGLTFHRGTNYPHVLRAGNRLAELAKRCGPVLTCVRLGAPGRSPATGFSGVEGIPGQQFQWTTAPEVSWTIDVPDSFPTVQIMIPFVHESRTEFAKGCVIAVNGKALPTSVQERSIFAETTPLPAGEALVTLRTGALTSAPGRELGLAIKVGDKPPHRVPGAAGRANEPLGSQPRVRL
jgi:2-polyprenyl-6-hydroxyphenyl methylase/3-demethylubiquinone-9 3-methyltransferase